MSLLLTYISEGFKFLDDSVRTTSGYSSSPTFSVLAFLQLSFPSSEPFPRLANVKIVLDSQAASCGLCLPLSLQRRPSSKTTFLTSIVRRVVRRIVDSVSLVVLTVAEHHSFPRYRVRLRPLLLQQPVKRNTPQRKQMVYQATVFVLASKEIFPLRYE